MFKRNTTLGEALESIEGSIRRVRHDIEAHVEGASLQLTPVGSYLLLVGSTAIGHVVSLGRIASGPWKAEHEQWFRNAAIDFAEAFATEEDLIIAPDVQCSTSEACPALVAQMEALAESWNDTFQMYAPGKLESSHWTKNKPSVSGKLFFFEADGSDPQRPRMLFDVDSSDTTKLNQIVWLSDTDQLSTYPDDEKLVLKFSGNELPAAPYYYAARR